MNTFSTATSNVKWPKNTGSEIGNRETLEKDNILCGSCLARKRTTEKLPVLFSATVVGRDERKLLVAVKYSKPRCLDHLSVEKLSVYYKCVDDFDNIFQLAGGIKDCKQNLGPFCFSSTTQERWTPKYNLRIPIHEH